MRVFQMLEVRLFQRHEIARRHHAGSSAPSSAAASVASISAGASSPCSTGVLMSVQN